MEEPSDKNKQLSDNNIKDFILGLALGSITPDLKVCAHLNFDADYLGKTCRDCKTVLAGSGFGGTESKCKHIYEQDEEGIETCTYCGEEKQINNVNRIRTSFNSRTKSRLAK